MTLLLKHRPYGPSARAQSRAAPRVHGTQAAKEWLMAAPKRPLWMNLELLRYLMIGTDIRCVVWNAVTAGFVWKSWK